MLRLAAVTVRRGAHVALDAVSVEVRAGELVLVEGGAGAGKTTLLEVAAARRRPDTGEVWIGGHAVTSLQGASMPLVRRNIGFVSAEPELLSRISVLDNVMLALGARLEPSARARAAALRALARLGVEAPEVDADAAALSSGARRLVAVARAIALEPALLLLDDPGAHLAPLEKAVLLSVLREVAATGTAVLCASPDPALVALALGSAPGPPAAVDVEARRHALERGRLIPGPIAMSVVNGGRASSKPSASSSMSSCPSPASPPDSPSSRLPGALP